MYKTITDDTFQEITIHGNSNFPFAYYPENIWLFDFHRIEWHWHNELEFLFAAKGNVRCSIGSGKLELDQGQGLFINRGILHQYEAESSGFTPNIVFSPVLLAPENSFIWCKYISPIINSSVSYQVFKPDLSWQNQVLQALLQIFDLQATKDKNELSIIQLLLQIWNLLYEYLDLPALSSDFCCLNHKQAKLQTMMQYIHNHYAGEITLEMIADSVPVSKSSALHIFQSGIHTSPIAYLIRYRLIQAAEKLRTTQKSIADIALETGFNSTGYFCRKFRQYYHVSANEYRYKKRT